jgi:hypothetical protein
MSDFSQTDFGYDPCLALFDKPLINTGILSHRWIQHRPISQISNTGVLEFTLPGTSPSYINLQCSFLQIQGKIVKENGEKVQEGDDVGFINIPLQSLWSQVDISLQQHIISARVGPNYAYKSYIDSLINFSLTQKEGQLSSQLFALDGSGLMDDPSNPGIYVRRKRTMHGQIVQLSAPLFLDLCEQD